MIGRIRVAALPSAGVAVARVALARVAVVLATGLLVSGCGPASTVSADSVEARPSTGVPGTVTPIRRPATPPATAARPAKARKPAKPAKPGMKVSQAEARSAAPATAPRAAPRLSALDRLAGVRSNAVVWRGSGKLRVVPGKSAAPGKGKVIRIRIEVEVGLKVDRAAFATYVLATLNDRRSWTEKGRRRFARTDAAADVRVILASPATSAAICRPLRTFGKLSCREGSAAVLTMYRWLKAIPEYAGNHDGYRRYVVNHEVGHALGHGHRYCGGRGRMAPVMMQQTKGLKGCRPNPWPHP